jgi:cellulose synthase/poly-beta-1,6-N-acetylglucosamine synthase-like glycosyltransferase
MSTLIQICFFFAAILIAYNYLIYPAAVILLARRKPSSETAAAVGDVLPSVTLIIAAYNEERVIESKIRNSLELDYPRDKLTILVVSDGSNDGTARIVAGFASGGVISLHQPQRRGKTAALNRAVANAKSDVIVFSDANNMFEPAAVRQLVRHFSNPEVGGVCGLKQIYDSPDRESSQGDGLYWRYESAIKAAESTLDSITAADGEIFAIRRSLYEPIDETLINDDAAITFALVAKGYRVLYERNAVSYEHASIRIEDDFHVKVRMVSGGFQTIAHHWQDIFPPRTWFAFNFFSHKVLRWLVPELLLVLAITSLVLAPQHPLYLAAGTMQAAFYALAWIGWLQRDRASPVVYIPFYFCAMNLAAFRGALKFLSGAQTTLWRKAER